MVKRLNAEIYPETLRAPAEKNNLMVIIYIQEGTACIKAVCKRTIEKLASY
jgi:hypothetical protein